MIKPDSSRLHCWYFALTECVHLCLRRRQSGNREACWRAGHVIPPSDLKNASESGSPLCSSYTPILILEFLSLSCTAPQSRHRPLSSDGRGQSIRSVIPKSRPIFPTPSRTTDPLRTASAENIRMMKDNTVPNDGYRGTFLRVQFGRNHTIAANGIC